MFVYIIILHFTVYVLFNYSALKNKDNLHGKCYYLMDEGIKTLYFFKQILFIFERERERDRQTEHKQGWFRERGRQRI